MDIRIKKTKKAIADAFLTMASQKPIEKITVTDIVKEAQINKSTFYAHYHDIYDLMDVLRNDAIEMVVSNMHYLSNLFDDPRLFFLEMYNALSICKSESIQPFSNSIRTFSEQLSQAMRNKAVEQGLHPERYHMVDTLLIFTINGIIALHKTSATSPIEKDDIETLADFFENGVKAITNA